jgi:hypothetical protein
MEILVAAVLQMVGPFPAVERCSDLGVFENQLD